MDVSTVFSRAPAGLAAPRVRVEVHLGTGLPMFALVGLPEAVVRESKERVRSALQTNGFDFPMRRITINLSPADIPKEGGRFDLPIAVGILAASGQLPADALLDREFYGELSLGGQLRRTSRLLPALIAGTAAGAQLILPAANAPEAGFVGSSQLKLAGDLRQVCDALQGRAVLPTACAIAQTGPRQTGSRQTTPDLTDVLGQFGAKRALEIAASGEHAILMIGPPGAGKTLLAQRLPGLLPPLSRAEALEVASLESIAGHTPRLDGNRPFRSPQHTASIAALIGGGALQPGELSLAHLGVLFLDELPEFARNVLEALREPLESGVVVLSRLRRTSRFPARFQLVAAMNPCPCGYAGDPRGRCRCTADEVARYRNRISGPLLDRIDLHVELRALPVEHLIGGGPRVLESMATVDTSHIVARRVAEARELQMNRQGKPNARLTVGEMTAICELDRHSKALLETAISKMGLSARAFHHVLKVARTCADLAQVSRIRVNDVAEALNLRCLDRAIC